MTYVVQAVPILCLAAVGRSKMLLDVLKILAEMAKRAT
jgi:hypothetical protein